MVNNIEEHFQFNSGQLKMATEWGKKTKGLDTCKVFLTLSDEIWKAVSVSNIFDHFDSIFTLSSLFQQQQQDFAEAGGSEVFSSVVMLTGIYLLLYLELSPEKTVFHFS